jgi:hypothetical protein
MLTENSALSVQVGCVPGAQLESWQVAQQASDASFSSPLLVPM